MDTNEFNDVLAYNLDNGSTRKKPSRWRVLQLSCDKLTIPIIIFTAVTLFAAVESIIYSITESKLPCDRQSQVEAIICKVVAIIIAFAVYIGTALTIIMLSLFAIIIQHVK
jgi:hypothetical protein